MTSLRAARERAGVGLGAAAKAAGLQPESLARLERCPELLTWPRARRLAVLYRVSITHLVAKGDGSAVRSTALGGRVAQEERRCAVTG